MIANNVPKMQSEIKEIFWKVLACNRLSGCLILIEIDKCRSKRNCKMMHNKAKKPNIRILISTGTRLLVTVTSYILSIEVSISITAIRLNIIHKNLLWLNEISPSLLNPV